MVTTGPGGCGQTHKQFNSSSHTPHPFENFIIKAVSGLKPRITADKAKFDLESYLSSGYISAALLYSNSPSPFAKPSPTYPNFGLHRMQDLTMYSYLSLSNLIFVSIHICAYMRDINFSCTHSTIKFSPSCCKSTYMNLKCLGFCKLYVAKHTTFLQS